MTTWIASQLGRENLAALALAQSIYFFSSNKVIYIQVLLLVGLPLAYVFSKIFSVGVEGLWIDLIIAIFVSAVCIFLCFFKSYLLKTKFIQQCYLIT